MIGYSDLMKKTMKLADNGRHLCGEIASIHGLLGSRASGSEANWDHTPSLKTKTLRKSAVWCKDNVDPIKPGSLKSGYNRMNISCFNTCMKLEVFM